MQGDLTTFFHDLVNSNRSTFNMYARNALKFKGVFSSANEVEDGQDGQWFVSTLEPTIYIFSDGSWHDIAEGSSEFSAEQIKNIVTLYIATMFGIVGSNTFIGAVLMNRDAVGNSESGLISLRGIDDNNVADYNKQAMILTSDVQFYMFDDERHIYSYGNTPDTSYLIFTPIPKETLGIDCGISEPYAFVAREKDGIWYYEHRDGVTVIPKFGPYAAGKYHDEFIIIGSFKTNGKVIIESTFNWNISVIDISLRNMIYRLINLEDHVNRIFVKTGINELGEGESIYNRLVMNEDETSILMSRTSELQDGLEETNSSVIEVNDDLIKLESKTVRHNDANSMVFAGYILPNSHIDTTIIYNRLSFVGINKEGGLALDKKYIVATPDGTTNEFDKDYINSSTSDTSSKYIVYSEQSLTSMGLTKSGTSDHFLILKNVDEVWYYDTGAALTILPGDGAEYGEGQYRSYFHLVAEFSNMPGENKILGSSLRYLCHRSLNNYTDVNAAIEINSTSITQRVSSIDDEGNPVTLAKIVVANQDEDGYVQIVADSIDIAGVVNFINTDAGTSTQISGDKIRTGTLESNVNAGTGSPYSWISLNDGTFSFGNGSLSWNGSLLNIEGSVTSYDGIIGGWEITDTSIQTLNAASETHAIYIHSSGDIYTKNFSNIEGEEAGWMITKEGNAYFNNIVARGTIYATDGVFNGTVYANDGVFTGTVYADDGVFNGTVYATNGEFTGTIHATGGEFSGTLYTEIGEIAGWIINHDSILGYYGEAPNRSAIELNKTLQYIGAYQEADLPGGIFIKIDEFGLPYANFGNKMVYSNGNLTFGEGVITWDNLDPESQTNISGYTAEISPNNASVYNDGSSITPSTQVFIARLIKNIDNTVVSGCTFAWSAVVPAGTYISSGQFGSTAIIDTSSQNGPAIYKCVITKDTFTFEASVSISYSSKGETGDVGSAGEDAVSYWLTVNKNHVVYNPNDETYDGAEESDVIFTAKKSVGSVVSNATGLYWEWNGISTIPDANGYQKTITVDGLSDQVNTIDIYDVSGGQLLDTATVDVIVAGEDSYSIVLSNEHQTIASDHEGNSPDPSSIVTTVFLFKGTEEVTDFTLSATGAVVDNIAKTVTVSPPEGATMSGQQVIAVLVDGVQIGTKTFTWSKSPQGDPGLDAEICWLISDKEVVMYDPNDDTYDGGAGSTIVFTAIKSTGNVISNPTNLYWSLNGSPTTTDINGYQKTITVNSNTTNVVSIYADSARTELLDTITVPVLVAGSDAYSIVLTNEHQTVKCFDDGTYPDPTLISTVVLLYKGTQLQSDSDFWIEASAGEVNQSFKSVSYTVPSNSIMSGDITVTVKTSEGGSIIGTKEFTWSKSPQGEPGEDGQDAEIYWLFANKDKVVYNPNNDTYDGGASSTIVFTAGKATGNVVSNPTDLYWTLNGVATSTDVNLYQKTVAVNTSDTTTVSIYKDEALTQLLDTVTVPVLSEGSNAYSIVLTNEHQTVYAKSDGTSPDPASVGTGVQLYFGTELATSYWIEASSGIVDQEFKIVTINIPNDSTESGSSTITVKTSEFGSVIGTKVFTWSKSNQGDQGDPGEDAKTVRLSATSQIFKTDQDNNIISGDITLNANLQNIAGTVTWTATPSIIMSNGVDGNEKIITAANFGENTAVRITASIDGYSDTITLMRVQEGSDAIVGFLTNESHNVPSDHDGSNPDLTGCSTTMKIFRGGVDVSSGWNYLWSCISGTSDATVKNTNTLTVGSFASDEAVWRCTATKTGFSNVIKDFTITKSKQGMQGDPGDNNIIGTLDNDSHVVATDSAGNNGVYTGCVTTMHVFNGVTDDTANWTFTYNPLAGVTASASGTYSNTISVSNMTVDSGYVDITAAKTGYTSITKRFTITKSKQGITGPAGQTPTSYWCVGAPAAIRRLEDGTYDPASFTVTGKKATGTSPVANNNGYIRIKYTTDGANWTTSGTNTSPYTFNSSAIPADAIALLIVMYQSTSIYTPVVDEEIVPIVEDGEDSLSIVLSASTGSATFTTAGAWSPTSISVTARAYKGGSIFTSLPATDFSMTGPLTTKTVTSSSGASTFTISTTDLDTLKASMNGLTNTFIFNISFTYNSKTYTAAFALNIRNDKFKWLNEWEGYTTINGHSIATPMLFVGSNTSSVLNGVYADQNGLVGLKGAASATDPFGQTSKHTFLLKNDGTAKIAGWSFDTTTLSSGDLKLVSGTNPNIQIGASAYEGTGIWLGRDSSVWKLSAVSASNHLKWDGTNLTIKGAITADTGYIGGSDGWVISAGRISVPGIELVSGSSPYIQAGPNTDNYKMVPTGFERTKEFPAKVYTVELKLRFNSPFSGIYFSVKYAYSTNGGSSWNGWYSGTSSFNIRIDSGDENIWQEITLRSNMPEWYYWGYQAIGASSENFKIKLLIDEGPYNTIKFSEADFYINGIHIGGLHTQSEWQNAEGSGSYQVTYGSEDDGYMACNEYYQDSATAFGISESSTNLSKIVPTILNSGEVLFDGTETSKLVCFGLELAPSQYEVVLIPTQQEISKTTWTPDTHNYKMHLDCRKAQKSPYGWFWLDYYVEEYSSDPSVYHADSAGLTSTYQTLFVGGSTMISAEVSVFHGGYFNFFKQRAWHQYATAGARTVKAKVVLGITYIDWGDGSVSEIGTFGTVHIRNIIEYRSASTTKPLTGKVNWILFQT